MKTRAQIEASKNAALNSLHLPKTETDELLSKLQNYKYIDNYDNIRVGGYVRWIDLRHPENGAQLTRGAIICDFYEGNCGYILQFRGFGGGKHYSICMDECLIFQKLSDDELVVLGAIEML